MRVKPNESSEPRELIPIGNYRALVSGIYDIGTQDGPYGKKHQIVVTYELHKKSGPVKDKQGRVLSISNFYGLTFNCNKEGVPSGLRRDSSAILNRTFTDKDLEDGFDVELLLSKPCRLQVGHKENKQKKTKDYIQSVAAWDDEDDLPDAQGDHHIYEIDASKPIPDWVPKWVQNQILGSEEFGGKSGASGDEEENPRPPTGGDGRQFDETATDGCPFDTVGQLNNWIDVNAENYGFPLRKAMMTWATKQTFPALVEDWDKVQIAQAYHQGVKIVGQFSS